MDVEFNNSRAVGSMASGFIPNFDAWGDASGVSMVNNHSDFSVRPNQQSSMFPASMSMVEESVCELVGGNNGVPDRMHEFTKEAMENL